MILLKSFSIENFRSIRELEMQNCGHLTALAGLNNAGKSNILRALNVFFNSQTDANIPYYFDDDQNVFVKRLKKAKSTKIRIDFSLPTNFKFHPAIAQVETMFGGREFAITKQWQKKEPNLTYYLNDELLDTEEARRNIDAFLRLVNFRYIPNRVLPLDVIREQRSAIREALVKRMPSKKKGEKTVFDEFQAAAQQLFKEAAERLGTEYGGLGDIAFRPPLAWDDLDFSVGYVLTQGKEAIQDSRQGSGLQSILMLETLYQVDRDYVRRFGWKQGAIWAIEEPESSLHADLEAKTARFLADIAHGENGRLQVFATTHSEFVVAYSDRPYLVSLVDTKDGTKIVGGTAPEIVEKASETGVSRWTHPLLFLPHVPLLLVEGKFDQHFWERALDLLNLSGKIRVAYLEILDGSGEKTGGDSELVSYIKDNARAIKTRIKQAPVAAIFDWDAPKCVAQSAKPFTKDDPFIAGAWDASTANPELGESIRGIERFYSTRLVLAAATERNIDLAKKASGQIVASKDEYGSLKPVIDRLVQQSMLVSDLEYARGFIESTVSKLIAGR